MAQSQCTLIPFPPLPSMLAKVLLLLQPVCAAPLPELDRQPAAPATSHVPQRSRSRSRLPVLFQNSRFTLGVVEEASEVKGVF